MLLVLSLFCLLLVPTVSFPNIGKALQSATKWYALPPDIDDARSPQSRVMTKARLTAFTCLRLAAVVAASSSTVLPSQVLANSSSSSSSSISPVITDYAFLDLKIANYTEESVGSNRGATGSGVIKIALFGKDAPQSVNRFLATLDGDGETTPSYVNCQFTRIVNGSLLEMERVRGINKISIAGSDSLEFKGNLLTDYTPILESNQLLHDKRGYLTRRQLSTGPEFGITMSDSAPELDGLHIIFGQVVEGLDVLDAVASIQRYSYKTSTGYAGKDKGSESDLADAWFEGQKKAFVGLSRQLGDSRAADLRGKLLRRVLIKKAGRSSAKELE